MEKSTETLTQELLFFKKSLKKKRKSQIWQQTIQFYRNNQSFIINYHILKLIKIVAKPLRSSVIKNCHYLAKLHKLYFQSVDDAKYNEQVRDHIKIIKNKMRAMENLLDCYTLALQSFITSSDPAYFKMVFQKDYHAKHPTKQLLFQPASVIQQKTYPKHVIEHQLSSYLSFVSEISIAYNTCVLCCQQQSTIIKCFKSVDKALYQIFNSSHKFATKRMMYQILKLNYLLKFQNFGQGTGTTGNSNKNQVQTINSSINIKLGVLMINKIIQIQGVKVEYNFPLQLIYGIYNKQKKQDQPRTKHFFMLILRYMYMIVLNINSPNLQISKKVGKCLVQNKKNQNIEGEIYILMKQILNLNKYFHINLESQFGKKSLQFISSVIERYQFCLGQKQKLNNFIFKYFDFQQIRNLSLPLNKNQKIEQKNNLISIKKQQQSRYKNRVIIQNYRISKKKINQNYQYSKIKINNLQSVGNKINKLFTQFGSVFNYIEQSCSDDLIHEFQNNRKQEIIMFQKKMQCFLQGQTRYQFQTQLNNQTMGKIKKQKQFFQIQQVKRKLNELEEKTERFRSYSETALKNLQRKKSQNIQQNKLQKLNCIYQNCQKLNTNNQPLNSEQYNLKRHEHKTQIISNKQNFLKNCTKLPALQKSKQNPLKLHKQYQPISLSDKYDKMSQMILLTNTSKQKNLHL